MKKYITLFFISVISTYCYGQQLYLIPQLGLNVNTYNFDETSSNLSDQRFSPGVTAGLGLNIGLNELRTFIIQPEINYSMRTNRTDHLLESALESNATTTVIQKSTLHYLEIPVLARFDFGIGTRYYFNIGPSFSYAFAGREKQESHEPLIESYNRKVDFDNRFNRTDWGAIIGGGVEFPVNDSFFVVDARFSWGFHTLYRSREVQSIVDGSPTSTTVGPEGKSRIITLSIGYALPLN
ncbi:hypothetical protein GCM10023231_22740 [Olivibacter ginsenosidimutans]|uniref:Outer membrane protein beta-barrel domain-containing protein n=1 Tax=Olivibacter ginsenosidimutans TaxID=1176537 RepID=A0ABP9BFN8_9SPHI